MKVPNPALWLGVLVCQLLFICDSRAENAKEQLTAAPLVEWLRNISRPEWTPVMIQNQNGRYCALFVTDGNDIVFFVCEPEGEDDKSIRLSIVDKNGDDLQDFTNRDKPFVELPKESPIDHSLNRTTGLFYSLISKTPDNILVECAVTSGSKKHSDNVFFRHRISLQSVYRGSDESVPSKSSFR